jgi:hypothetical protein
MKCCNETIVTKKLEENKYGAFCRTCKRQAEGKTKEEAYNNLLQAPGKALAFPNAPGQLQSFIKNKFMELQQLASPIVTRKKGAFERMVTKNVRYITNQTDPYFLNAWKSDEGQASIIEALEEAFHIGATLPDMGYIIPFADKKTGKTTVTFIPSKEAFEFSLCNGENAPFRFIRVECIHENDDFVPSRKNGEFSAEFKSFGKPRGDLIQIAVYGYNNKMGMVIGEIYDITRLYEKALKHSRQPAAYQGPNKEEMFSKMALKSFFKGFVRVRGSEAAFEDLRENQEAADRIIDSAIDQIEDEIIEVQEG